MLIGKQKLRFKNIRKKKACVIFSLQNLYFKLNEQKNLIKIFQNFI